MNVLYTYFNPVVSNDENNMKLPYLINEYLKNIKNAPNIEMANFIIRTFHENIDVYLLSINDQHKVEDGPSGKETLNNYKNVIETDVDINCFFTLDTLNIDEIINTYINNIITGTNIPCVKNMLLQILKY